MIAAVPSWVAILVGLLVLMGSALALIGSLGLLRLPTFYERIHPPTMGTTLGIGFVVVASTLLTSAAESRAALHPIVLAVFAFVTTPVTYMLLVRAAVHRDNASREERVIKQTTHEQRPPGE